MVQSLAAGTRSSKKWVLNGIEAKETTGGNGPAGGNNQAGGLANNGTRITFLLQFKTLLLTISLEFSTFHLDVYFSKKKQETVAQRECCAGNGFDFALHMYVSVYNLLLSVHFGNRDR